VWLTCKISFSEKEDECKNKGTTNQNEWTILINNGAILMQMCLNS